jgi:uncharacterized protein YjcR
VVADLGCSPGAICEWIRLEGVDIQSPVGGTSVVVRDKVKGRDEVECVRGSELEGA